MIRKSISALAPLALLSLLTACGGKQPPPKAAALDEEPVETSSEGSDMAVSSDIGGLNEGQVTRAFEKSLKGLQTCLKKGAKHNEFLGGEIAFTLMIDRTGSIAERSVTSSTIGDRETEKCMLGVLAEQSWPKPVGGEKGKAENSFTFDPPNDVRPPIDWSSDELSKSLEELSDEIETCKNGANGSFSVTMYVKKDGTPLSVGMAYSGDGDTAADCLVGVLMSVKYPSPGSWAAKVQFEL